MAGSIRNSLIHLSYSGTAFARVGILWGASSKVGVAAQCISFGDRGIWCRTTESVCRIQHGSRKEGMGMNSRGGDGITVE